MCRLKSTSLALLVPIFVCSLAFAQGRSPSTAPAVCEIQVRVSYANERPVGQQIMVELLNEQSVPGLQTFTDSEGRALFHIAGGGVYRARATGTDIEQAVSDPVNIEPSDRSAIIWLHVQQKVGAGTPTNTSTAPVTSASELRIPADAKKSFMKGMEALYRHDYQKAAELFEKATVAYPQYDAAYDNLGATFMQLGQPGKAREAFERAVQLNDKNADADRNYARLLIADREYTRAMDLLKKSLTVDPQNPSALTLLSIVQLQSADVDGALQSALKVHQLSHEGYAVAHYIAGRAYEVKHQYQQATAEYETYLREDPNGPEIQQVRTALAHVTAMADTTPQSSTTPQ
jgi:tetratricopeptide (TPR) repeat protein